MFDVFTTRSKKVSGKWNVGLLDENETLDIFVAFYVTILGGVCSTQSPITFALVVNEIHMKIFQGKHWNIQQKHLSTFFRRQNASCQAIEPNCCLRPNGLRFVSWPFKCKNVTLEPSALMFIFFHMFASNMHFMYIYPIDERVNHCLQSINKSGVTRPYPILGFPV